MALNKLRYDFDPDSNQAGGGSPDGCERTFEVKMTLDRGINASGVLHWQVPANIEAFTDLSETALEVKFKVFKADGTALGDDDRVFVNPGYLQCLFSTCTVALNGTPLPVNNHFTQTTTLLSYIGTTEDTRTKIWLPLSGFSTNLQRNSTVANPTPGTYDSLIAKIAKSKMVTLTGRLYSDFFMSCAQHLPPGIRMDVRLTRQPTNFSLVNGAGGEYRIDFQSASLTVKRVVYRPDIRQSALNKFSNGGRLKYNRLSTVLMPVPQGTQVFKWNNVYNSCQLPHTIYMVLLSQKAYYGDLRRLSNFFETGGLSSVSFNVSGRAVMAEPYKCDFVYKEGGNANRSLLLDDSEALSAYKGLVARLGCFQNPAKSPGLSYTSFLQGSTIFVAQLQTCGGNQMEPGGSLDVELHFKTNTPEPYLVMIFGEQDSIITLDQHLNVTHQI